MKFKSIRAFSKVRCDICQVWDGCSLWQFLKIQFIESKSFRGHSLLYKFMLCHFQDLCPLFFSKYNATPVNCSLFWKKSYRPFEFIQVNVYHFLGCNMLNQHFVHHLHCHRKIVKKWSPAVTGSVPFQEVHICT